MRILVTGVAGQVCSHIADVLLAAGHTVYGIDCHLSGVYNTPEGVSFIRKQVQDVVTWPEVDAVVHGASYAELAGNWRAQSERAKLFEHNEVATRALLESISPEVPLVYLSSASVYGSQCDGSGKLLTERAHMSIESPYAASKAACELYVHAWCHKSKQPHYILRLCNQMGSRTHRGIVPDFVRMGREGHIHARDNGEQTRSWIHVLDTAQAVRALLEKRAPSGVYNVASEELWSWRDLVKLMKFEGRLTWEPQKSGAIGDPVDIRLDAGKLREFYEPTRSIASAFQDALDYAKWAS